MKAKIRLLGGLLALAMLSACAEASPADLDLGAEQATADSGPTSESEFEPRPAYEPGTLVEYEAQTGDTLLALAARFNSSVEEIRGANPIIPADASTLPAGLPMQIPIYYRAYWGSQYLILPDGHYPNGPYQSEFSAVDFVAGSGGWLELYSGTAAREVLSGAAMIDLVATNFSISPRLLLALVEERAQGISGLNVEIGEYPLGYAEEFYEGLYLQLVWVANTLNNGYYGWRGGKLIEFELLDGSLYRPDPWQNASSVALQYLYSKLLPKAEFERAIGADGFARVYAELFGDPWADLQAHIPGSLMQPELRLPFESGEAWTYTGGPHTGWGEGQPWAAIDFAPGTETSGCVQSEEWVTAMADGLVVRTGEGIVVLDLDRDGDERTGWVLFYLHVEERGRVREGTLVRAGQPLGHPSCEGGSSTGTHVHIARKYNGEWMLASGDLPFVMEGWEVVEASSEYAGQLVQPGRVVTACRCSDAGSRIVSVAEAAELPTPAEVEAPSPTTSP